MDLNGLHHISAIASSRQDCEDFYAGLLGLSPVTERGSGALTFTAAPDLPGGVLSFAVTPGVGRGVPGRGLVHRLQWSVPGPEALEHWRRRLEAAGITVTAWLNGAGDPLALRFADPDGLEHELTLPPAFVLGTDMPVQGRTPHSYRPLADVATRQHGAISMAQLRDLGYAKSTVIEWVAAGRLHQLHRGVYAVGHRRLTWHSRCWAAVLGAEANEVDEVVWPAVASHGSAAYLWGLYRYAPERIDVTAPIRRRAKREFVVHFSSILALEDRGEREGIPVTSVARTLLDLAIRATPLHLERLLERAEELELLDLHAVEDVLDRAGGHCGRGRLRRALALYEPDPTFTRSRFEKQFRRLVLANGLPAPSMNFNAHGFELDAYWPDHRFAVELDLFETHGTRAAFERDRLRQEELKLAGIEMIRVTKPRLGREPDAVMRNLATLLARRGSELHPP